MNPKAEAAEEPIYHQDLEGLTSFFLKKIFLKSLHKFVESVT